jgi:hypothetical protein
VVDDAHHGTADQEELGSDARRAELGVEAIEGAEDGGAIEGHGLESMG